ncbi:MAG: nuclear transport factor 2 family protein [Acidobacteriota bacterium]
MSNITELVDRYVSMWNETDTKRRRNLIAEIWTETASYIDPILQAEGFTGIDAMVQGFQERFPGYRFRRTSEVDAHNNRIRFKWELAPIDGPIFAAGTDFGVVTANNRLQTITGFIDHLSNPPSDVTH